MAYFEYLFLIPPPKIDYNFKTAITSMSLTQSGIRTKLYKDVRNLVNSFHKLTDVDRGTSLIRICNSKSRYTYEFCHIFQ